MKYLNKDELARIITLMEEGDIDKIQHEFADDISQSNKV